MLSEEQELEIVRKLVKTDAMCHYFKNGEINGINITPSPKMEITIVDDDAIEIDTTGKSINEVVQSVLSKINI